MVGRTFLTSLVGLLLNGRSTSVASENIIAANWPKIKLDLIQLIHERIRQLSILYRQVFWYFSYTEKYPYSSPYNSVNDAIQCFNVSFNSRKFLMIIITFLVSTDCFRTLSLVCEKSNASTSSFVKGEMWLKLQPMFLTAKLSYVKITLKLW